MKRRAFRSPIQPDRSGMACYHSAWRQVWDNRNTWHREAEKADSSRTAGNHRDSRGMRQRIPKH
jgi:hypothetical protein